MSTESLPCFTCGKSLINVHDASDNQPNDATTFISYGQYGSTFFDPMDGQSIEVNLCDECLEARRDRILWSRPWRRVMCEGFEVGRERTWRPTVPFSGQDRPGPDDVLNVQPEDLMSTTLSDHIQWWVGGVNQVRRALGGAR